MCYNEDGDKMNLNKKNIFIVVGVLLFILIVLAVLSNDKTADTKNKKRINNDSDIKLEVENEQLYDKIDKKANDESSSIITRIELYLPNKIPIEDVDKLSDLEKTYLLVISIAEKYNKKVVSEEEVKKIYNDYFLSGNIYKKDIVINDKVMYEYKKGMYISSNNLTNAPCSNFSNEIAFIVDDDSWYIEKQGYFFNYDNPEGSQYISMYKTYKDCMKKKNKIIVVKQNTAYLSDDDYKKVSSKLKIYRYRFVYTNNNFYLKSILEK